MAASLLTRHLELLPKSAHYYFLLPPTDSPEPSRPARDLFKLEFFEKESVKYRITMLSSVAMSASPQVLKAVVFQPTSAATIHVYLKQLSGAAVSTRPHNIWTGTR